MSKVSIPLSYEEDISDYMLAFVHDALEELKKENLFDNWGMYENVDDEKTVSVTRQRTDTEGEKRGVILMKKLAQLKTKKNVKKEIHYLLDGYMPELDEHRIGKKLNKLWKLIDESEVNNYELQEQYKKFVDKIRHWIRHDLYPMKYTTEEYISSKIADYSPTKDNLKECNRIYKEYVGKRNE